MTKCCKPQVPQPPFYTHPCSDVTEDHARHILVHQYAATIRISDSWIVPSGINPVIVTVPAVIEIMIGSYLWNPAYGYFRVVSFDRQSQTVSLVRMQGVGGTVAAGTEVPGCTQFVITAQAGGTGIPIINPAGGVQDCMVPVVTDGANEVAEWGFVDTCSIEDEAVTTAKIDDFAVDSNKIAANAITSSKVALGAILNMHLEDAGTGTAFTPSLHPYSVGALTSFSVTGFYWMLGPWCLAYINGTGVVAGSPLSNLFLNVPFTPVYPPSGTRKYPMFLNYRKTLGTSGEFYTDTQVTVLTSDAYISIVTENSVLVGQTIAFDFHVFYPVR